ncbi:EamA family transporter [Novosphingobium sp. KCTC 2891]|uniref:DMT family transporter n=1 Tax=Novosphingobium sp. KCTC 2891 TaxID=2989730 RepID=UPI002221B1CD|nr:EamA family transporter [Novosphingobium sp. KCTC 2891]MCW1382393.1 EamA family transporter [Novosphingobium sp. KCTC 2891]
MSQPADHPWTPRTIAGFALITLVWGSTWLVIKDQIGTVPPSWSVVWRFALAGTAMFVLAALRGEKLALGRAGQRLALLIGVLQFCLNFQFVYRAERFLTSGIVAVLFALLLVPNSLLARAFLGQRITRGFVAGSAIALAGIALLLLHEYRLAPPGGQVPLGVALTLAGLISASGANVLQASAEARRHSPVALLAWAMLWGTLADVAVAWALHGPPQFEMRTGYFGGIAYLALLGSVLTFPIYSRLLRDLGPGRAAYSSVIIPVVAMLLSTLFEGYAWSLLAAAGSALAMLGLVVALKARSPSR